MIEISGQIKWNEPSFHAVLLGYKNKNSCLVVCLRKVDGILHLLSTTVESEIITALWLIANSNIFSDSDETSSSATALYYLHIMHQLIFFYWTPFLFFFFKLLYLLIWYLCPWTCLSLVQSWIFCYLTFFSEILFTVNKANINNV